MLVSGPQLRAGRAAAGITRAALAERAGVGVTTVQRLETAPGRLRVTAVTRDSLEAALARHGVQFVEHDGVPGITVRPRGA